MIPKNGLESKKGDSDMTRNYAEKLTDECVLAYFSELMKPTHTDYKTGELEIASWQYESARGALRLLDELKLIDSKLYMQIVSTFEF